MTTNPAHRGAHNYELADFGLTTEQVHERVRASTWRPTTQPLDRVRRTRRRSKLAPDPDVRRTIVAAAAEALREQGVRGLSVAAVLDRAELSTRAFYRHFESKDHVVAAVFLEMAQAEKRRLQRRMAKAARSGRSGGRLDRRTPRSGV